MGESSFYYQMSCNVFGSSDFPNDDNINNPADKGLIFDPISDFFGFDEWLDHEDEQASSVVSGSTSNTIVLQASEVDDSGGNSNLSIQHEANRSSNSRGGSHERREVRDKVAFKTKSDVEILNDGFKWRKYGKKMVKNSPNPRNYYKCSVEGCLVKKRVERDRQDPGYVITTYEGVHNHESPNF